MPKWHWNKKQKMVEAPVASTVETVTFTRQDLEIEKKWLQRSRVDPSKFEYFYRKYYDTILVFISREIKNPEVAQEMTNEVFSIALDRLDKFQWQGYSFGAWLFRIARNLRFTKLRYQKQNPEVPWDPDLSVVEDSTGTLADLKQKDDVAVLAFCMESLTPVCRQVFKACYWTGLKVREIAIIMGMSDSNVNNHLHRGRNQLLRCLLKNGMERGLSAKKMKMISESTIREEGWSMVGDEDSESS